MLEKIKQSTQTIKSFLQEVQKQLCQELDQLIEVQLESEVTTWLYREYLDRRAGVKRYVSRIVKQLDEAI